MGTEGPGETSEPRTVAAAERGPHPILILPSLSCKTSGPHPGLCKTGGQTGGLLRSPSSGRVQTSNTRAPSKGLRTSLCCEDMGTPRQSASIQKQPFTYPCSRQSPLFLGWSPLPGSPWPNPGLRSGCALCVFKHITNHRGHADTFRTINSREKKSKITSNFSTITKILCRAFRSTNTIGNHLYVVTNQEAP